VWLDRRVALGHYGLVSRVVKVTLSDEVFGRLRVEAFGLEVSVPELIRRRVAGEGGRMAVDAGAGRLDGGLRSRAEGGSNPPAPSRPEPAGMVAGESPSTSRHSLHETPAASTDVLRAKVAELEHAPIGHVHSFVKHVPALGLVCECGARKPR
jgi:hypothetical protein